MNAQLGSQNVQGEPKGFGFGYETRSADSPSVQTARAEFLTIILRTKPEAVFSLFSSGYPPFLQLLERSKHIIVAICEEVEANIPEEAYILRQPKFIREKALKRLIPNSLCLETIEGATPLHRALEDWASSHNLRESWFLDDVLQFLRTLDVADNKSMAFALLPDAHCLIDLVKRSWQSVAVERRLSGLHRIYQSSAAVEEREAFSFAFKYEDLEFVVSGPFYKSVTAFKQEVNNQFEALGGKRLRGARKDLSYRLTAYLAKVSKIIREQNLTAPPSYRKWDQHFKWLVDYQLPPCKTYRQIAREVERDEKTVREGIHRSAELIGLTLRSNEADKHFGRPKGSKDKATRRRVDRRREKVRGNAN